MTAPPTAERVVRITPRRSAWRLELGELWDYRELLWVLARRDVQVRYRQTLLGMAWALVQPLSLMGVLYLVFDRIAKVPTGGVPYPLFAFAGLALWQFFARTLSQASTSVVDFRLILTRIYFPRLLLPMSPQLAAVPDFAVSFAVLLVMTLGSGRGLPATALLVPAFVLLAICTSLAASLWLSALNAHYRDFQAAVPFLIQIWFFATPIAYPTSCVPSRWGALYYLNPMVGILDGFRWALFGTPFPSAAEIWIPAAAVAVLVVGGLPFYREMERTFVDVV